jgi:hypothetical protein
MFEVLVFVYENYWRGDACPEPEQLGRKLSAHGFEAEEIREALHWLDGLSLATQGMQIEHSAEDRASATVRLGSPPEAALPQSSDSMRVYSQAEQDTSAPNASASSASSNRPTCCRAGCAKSWSSARWRRQAIRWSSTS